jgi:hypothetical protein
MSTKHTYETLIPQLDREVTTYITCTQLSTARHAHGTYHPMLDLGLLTDGLQAAEGRVGGVGYGDEVAQGAGPGEPHNDHADQCRDDQEHVRRAQRRRDGALELVQLRVLLEHVFIERHCVSKRSDNTYDTENHWTHMHTHTTALSSGLIYR